MTPKDGVTDGVTGGVAVAPSKTVAPKQGPFYIPSLDGIRAASVLWVFLGHAGLADWGVPGNLGVTVFFFLSGFLITTLLRMEFDASGGISLGAFYLRRTLRIFPPMYLVQALASGLTFVGAIEGSLQPQAVLAQVLHLTNYYVIYAGWWEGRAPGTWVFWSLAVEEHFYLAFPLAYLFLRRFVPSRSRQMLVLIGVCAAVLAWRLVLVFGLDAIKERTYIATDTRVDSILFGCILAVYGNPVLDPTWVSARWWKLFWLPLGVVGLLASIGIRNPQFQETFRYTLQGLALFPLFVVAIRYPDWAPCRLLNLGWVKFIGVLSYSLYLLHTTVLFAVEQWTRMVWHPLIQGSVALAVCLLLAVAIYYLVEQPCARLRRRLSRVGNGPGHTPAERRGASTASAVAAGPDRGPRGPWLSTPVKAGDAVHAGAVQAGHGS